MEEEGENQILMNGSVLYVFPFFLSFVLGEKLEDNRPPVLPRPFGRRLRRPRFALRVDRRDLLVGLGTDRSSDQ